MSLNRHEKALQLILERLEIGLKELELIEQELLGRGELLERERLERLVELQDLTGQRRGRQLARILGLRMRISGLKDLMLGGGFPEGVPLERSAVPTKLKLFYEGHKHNMLKVGKLFNRFAGTSTGAILSSGAGFASRPGSTFPKYDANEILNVYKDEGPRIFSKGDGAVKMWRDQTPKDMAKRLWLTVGARLLKGDYCYHNGALKNALRDRFGRSPLRRVCRGKKAIVIACRVNEGAGAMKWRPWSVPPRWDTINEKVFQSNDPLDAGLLLSKVCLASAAAPVYFEAAHVNGVKYLDGGLLANNPSIQALERAEDPRDLFASLGTGMCPEAGPSARFFGGEVLQRITNVKDVSVDSIDRQVEKAHQEMEATVRRLSQVAFFPNADFPSNANFPYLRLQPLLAEEIAADGVGKLEYMEGLMDLYLQKLPNGNYNQPSFQSLLDRLKQIVLADPSICYNMNCELARRLRDWRTENNFLVIEFEDKWIEYGRIQTLTAMLCGYTLPPLRPLSLRLVRCGLSNEAANALWEGIENGRLRVKEVDLSGNDIDLCANIERLNALLANQASRTIDDGTLVALTRIVLNNTDFKMNIDAPSDERLEEFKRNRELALQGGADYEETDLEREVRNETFNLANAIKGVFFHGVPSRPTLVEQLGLNQAHLFEQFGWFDRAGGEAQFNEFLREIRAPVPGQDETAPGSRLAVDCDFARQLLTLRRAVN